MKLKSYLFGILLLCLSATGVLAETTVPMQLNVSAVLRYSDGTAINSTSTQNILIGLYTSETNYVWRRSVPVFFVNGLVEANLLGPGTDLAKLDSK